MGHSSRPSADFGPVGALDHRLVLELVLEMLRDVRLAQKWHGLVLDHERSFLEVDARLVSFQHVQPQ